MRLDALRNFVLLGPIEKDFNPPTPPSKSDKTQNETKLNIDGTHCSLGVITRQVSLG